MKMVIKTSMDY